MPETVQKTKKDFISTEGGALFAKRQHILKKIVRKTRKTRLDKIEEGIIFKESRLEAAAAGETMGLINKEI